jgi:hypothetical protein
MTHDSRKLTLVLSLAAVAALVASIALAQSTQDKKPAPAGGGAPAQSDAQLPPGWTADDMKACTEAATPGKMHQELAKRIGVWAGDVQMWMAPGVPEPSRGTCTWTVSDLMDGRFLKCEMSSELPAMGHMDGFGLTGYDNVMQKFVGTWIDNHGTGIMNGTGEMSPDGKTFTWTYNHSCPITKKPVVIRQIETITGPDTWKFEMFSTDPKSNKEFKCIQIDYKKKSS